MLRRFIYRLFRMRHYWRLASFDEIAELYASRLITVFAINIINLFAAVYLYKLGYSLELIALLYALWYALKLPIVGLVAKYTAYAGPKHSILVGNLIRIPSLIAFALVPFAGEYAFWAVMVFGFLQQVSAAFYNVGYLVDFSKIKNSKHTGKEIGNMQIIEKLARIVSPLVGGTVAAIYGAEAAIILACILFAFASLPLFRSVEPTKTRIKLKFVGFPWQHTLPSIVASSAIGYNFIVNGLVWTMFMTLVILGGMGDSVYAALGGFASLGVLASMVAAWTFGHLVDRRKGGVLLLVGTIGNSLVQLIRPFVSTATGIVGTNVVAETTTSAYAMPFTRIMLDTADSSGFRITYVMMIELMENAAAGLACLVLALAVAHLGEYEGMVASLVIGAFFGLIMLGQRRAAH